MANYAFIVIQRGEVVDELTKFLEEKVDTKRECNLDEIRSSALNAIKNHKDTLSYIFNSTANRQRNIVILLVERIKS